MKVLVVNQFATNKGDRAVLYFVLRQLRRIGIEHITVSTTKPRYWESGPDVPAENVEFVHSGWNVDRKTSLIGRATHRAKYEVKRRVHFPLVRAALISGRRPVLLGSLCDHSFLSALERADVVICTGGHRLTTINAGSMVMPQSFNVAVALICKKPLALWSQSVGPFEFKHAKNRIMVQKILAGASQIFIRDQRSLDEIRGLGLSTDRVSQTCDSVFGLADTVESQVPPSQRSKMVGLSVWTGRKADPTARKQYIESFAALVRHAVGKGYEVQLYPMELEGADYPYLEQIAAGCGSKADCKLMGFPSTPEHLALISKCRIFVGHKTHSQIFSLTAGTPLLAVAYHPKTEDFMRRFQLDRYCIPDAQYGPNGGADFHGERLIELFGEIESNLDDIWEAQRRVGAELCAQVQRDFAELIRKLRAAG